MGKAIEEILYDIQQKARLLKRQPLKTKVSNCALTQTGDISMLCSLTVLEIPRRSFQHFPDMLNSCHY
jgi:hypothetical protein